MLIGYTAVNRKTKEQVEFFAHDVKTASQLNTLNARQWMDKNLELYYNWDFCPNGKFKHDTKPELKNEEPV